MAEPDLAVPIMKSLVREFLRERGMKDALRVFDRERVCSACSPAFNLELRFTS